MNDKKPLIKIFISLGCMNGPKEPQKVDQSHGYNSDHERPTIESLCSMIAQQCEPRANFEFFIHHLAKLVENNSLVNYEMELIGQSDFYVMDIASIISIDGPYPGFADSLPKKLIAYDLKGVDEKALEVFSKLYWNSNLEHKHGWWIPKKKSNFKDFLDFISYIVTDKMVGKTITEKTKLVEV
ncbi:MAG: hypothetical protein OEX08_02980 [Candidatus Nomurabacteria bacterium]|nr:hypothetical protein [Candidatus Nomurabacteria bacterium]